MNELTVTYGNQRITLQPGQFAHIGRRNDNAVVIEDPRVSRQHLRLNWAPKGVWTLETWARLAPWCPDGRSPTLT